MKKLHRKSIVLLIALILLLTCAVGGTVAVLSVGAGPLKNTFTSAELDTKIVESFSRGVKSAVKVQNNGSIDAYVRVGVYGYWAVKDESEAEKIIAPWTPSFSVGSGWEKVGDWYYYTSKLAPNGAMTTDLLGSDIEGNDKPASYPSAYLVVNVIHQAIQAEPASAREDAKWDWDPS